MASAEIFICDRCESYVSDKELHIVVMSIRPGAGHAKKEDAIITKDPGGYQPGLAQNLTREVCPKCAESLLEELKLSLTIEQLNKEAFSNFDLNKPVAQLLEV